MSLVLREPRLEDHDVCLDAHSELALDHFDFLLGFEPSLKWSEYLDMLKDCVAGRNLASDRVPAAFLLADVDGQVVGRISIRFALNDFLSTRGGHIGYAVRPAYRRRGYATVMLAQGLMLANARGIDPVLVTCEDSNAGSAAAIERGGGILESTFVGDDGVHVRRYWIAKSIDSPATPTGA